MEALAVTKLPWKTVVILTLFSQTILSSKIQLNRNLSIKQLNKTIIQLYSLTQPMKKVQALESTIKNYKLRVQSFLRRFTY